MTSEHENTLNGPLAATVALITGGGRGIGRATATLLASRGARVALMSRTRSEVEAAAADISKSFGPASALPLVGDVSSEADVAECFSKVDSAFGPINCLINNAGLLLRRPIAELSLADWNQVFGTSVTGSFLCAKQAWPRMLRAGSGCIVNVSSLSGIRGTQKFPGFGAYIASKHAVVGLTEALSVEGKSCGIRANCVAPGAVDTQMLRTNVPEFKAGTGPEQIAEVIAYLCDPRASGALSGAVIEVHSNA